MTWDDAYSRLAELITDIENDGQVSLKSVPVEKAPKTLYAIVDLTTDRLIFDSNGFPYKSETKAITKLNTLKTPGSLNRFRIVHYILKENLDG